MALQYLKFNQEVVFLFGNPIAPKGVSILQVNLFGLLN